MDIFLIPSKHAHVTEVLVIGFSQSQTYAYSRIITLHLTIFANLHNVSTLQIQRASVDSVV